MRRTGPLSAFPGTRRWPTAPGWRRRAGGNTACRRRKSGNGRRGIPTAVNGPGAMRGRMALLIQERRRSTARRPWAPFRAAAAECGAQDMSGNVWEWTASFYDDDQDTYACGAARGSSIEYVARVADRYWQLPGRLVRLRRVSGGLPRVLTAVCWISDFCNGGFGGSPPKAAPRSGSPQICVHIALINK